MVEKVLCRSNSELCYGEKAQILEENNKAGNKGCNDIKRRNLLILKLSIFSRIGQEGLVEIKVKGYLRMQQHNTLSNIHN